MATIAVVNDRCRKVSILGGHEACLLGIAALIREKSKPLRPSYRTVIPTHDQKTAFFKRATRQSRLPDRSMSTTKTLYSAPH